VEEEEGLNNNLMAGCVVGYQHKIDREHYSRPGKSIAFALLRMFGVPVFVPDRLPIR
jgi:hypothetical protein